MATVEPALQDRPDGRKYARITRRCVALAKHIQPGRTFNLSEIANEVTKKSYPEFIVIRNDRPVQIRVGRIGDYLTYLNIVRILISTGNNYTLNLTKPSKDQDWAQTLSDLAREHIASELNTTPAVAPDKLKEILNKLHRKKVIPTIDEIIADIGKQGTAEKERLRWSLYMYADGPACELGIRQYSYMIQS